MATTEQVRAERGTATRAEVGPLDVLETEVSVTEVVVTDRGAWDRGEEASAEALTEGQRWLVQTSWEKVASLAPHVAELFYDRLFELDPLLEDLFPANLADQGTELMAAIG